MTDIPRETPCGDYIYPSMKQYQLTSDRLFYFLCCIFAFLATFLPSFSGRPWMLAGLQGAGLWAFTALAAAYGPPGRHVAVCGLWLLTQVLTLLLTLSWNLSAVEHTIPGGFELHRRWLELYYTAAGPGPGIPGDRWTLSAQVLLASIGSLATGGLTGSMVLSGATNYLALGLGVYLHDIPGKGPVPLMQYALHTIPWARAVLMAGLYGLHLSLAPWWWRRRAVQSAPWPWQRPMLLASALLAAAGLAILLWFG